MKRRGKSRIARVVILCSMVLMVSLFGGGSKAEAAKKYPYLIKINKRCNVVTVYGKDSKGKYTKPVKAFPCSTGKATPLGTFHTEVKYRWKILNHGVWGQYSTRITGNYLFHSVWYYEKDPSKLSIKQYNRLGTTASAGCVRLTTADAKWIYDNCGLGTTVTIYNSKNPGPLGKPSAMKISKYSWDPTDIWSKKNPWNNKKPYIKGTSNKTVYIGQGIDFKSGVKAYDTCGNNVTKTMKIDTRKLNLKKAGTYQVTYSVTDLIGRTAKKTINVKVLAPRKLELIGATNKLYRYETYKNKKLDSYVMNDVYGKIGNSRLDKKYLSYTYKVTKNDKSAIVYQVIYTAKNPDNGSKVTRTVTITLDKQAPTVSCIGLQMTEKEYAAFVKEVEAKKYSHASFKDNITSAAKLIVTTVIINKSEDTKEICYTVKDQAGNVIKAYQTITIIPVQEEANEETTVGGE